jgi:hypothetical protein
LRAFFRIIDEDANPNEYALACQSPYFVGAVHEDEVANGINLVTILCEKGCRKIALEGWEAGDATFLLRWEGYQQGIEEWNTANPDDQAVLLDPQYGGTTSDTGRATAEAIINANPDIDALIVAGGGGDTLVGALAANRLPRPQGHDRRRFDGLPRRPRHPAGDRRYVRGVRRPLLRPAVCVHDGLQRHQGQLCGIDRRVL